MYGQEITRILDSQSAWIEILLFIYKTSTCNDFVKCTTLLFVAPYAANLRKRAEIKIFPHGMHKTSDRDIIYSGIQGAFFGFHPKTTFQLTPPIVCYLLGFANIGKYYKKLLTWRKNSWSINFINMGVKPMWPQKTTAWLTPNDRQKMI